MPADNLLEAENFMTLILNSVSHRELSCSEFKAISKMTTSSRTTNCGLSELLCIQCHVLPYT